MVTDDDVRELALVLPGAAAYPHFDRTAFKARTTFATLGGGTVNLKLIPEQAETLIAAEPEVFLRLGKWTNHGFVGARLAELDRDRLEVLLRQAWRNAAPKGAVLDD